ncbi:DUF1697 domain-containing protein [Paenibacillus lactis]|uniref:DUF1697 domain-containing protein n=1 Tax=Paenibacillus TaxID=44249 RepID=UPI00203E0C4D|nr:DUF1697 domain-containing protein [Paenibacillus lactis]
MTIYIALLRGINVGGHHKIKMADLKTLLEGLGLSRVQTYMQSGNVLFESPKSKTQLKELFENGIREAFGYSISVIFRTGEEMEDIIRSCPFSEAMIQEADEASAFVSFYVGMLPDVPSQEEVDKLVAAANEEETIRCIGSIKKSARDSKLTNQLQKLSVPVTMRNWKTTNKLAQLAAAMKP